MITVWYMHDRDPVFAGVFSDVPTAARVISEAKQAELSALNLKSPYEDGGPVDAEEWFGYVPTPERIQKDLECVFTDENIKGYYPYWQKKEVTLDAYWSCP